jgi:branched-chain amino acid transport system ATP-binding protein
VLTVEGVSKRFAGLQALRDVSFEVGEGRIAGLIGPNGAGKTTLFNTISGALAPDDGRIAIAGTEVTGWPAYRIARLGVGRTFQVMKPFAAMSVRENVEVATLRHGEGREAARRQADAVLERVGLGEWAGRPAGALPTAGRKRLELARALATRPRLLLLDEVLAGLVPAERAPLLDLLAALRDDDGVTMLLVEHVMAAVMRLSDEVFVLHHGELLASGPPEVVTRDERVVDAYLGEPLVAEA